MKTWRGRPAGEWVRTIDVGHGLAVITAPFVPPEPCVRCGEPAVTRWHDGSAPRLWPVHAECARATLRDQVPA